MALICPYCDIEINEKQLEAEDGCCPECGAFITAMDVMSDDESNEGDEYGDEFDEDSAFGPSRDDEYEDDIYEEEFGADDDYK